MITALITIAAFASACDIASKGSNEQASAGGAPQQATPTPQMTDDDRAGKRTLTGEAAQGDWTTDAPGVRRKLTPADLPPPFATQSVRNHPRKVGQPPGAWPQVPRGFRVEKFAEGMTNPRMIRTAP